MNRRIEKVEDAVTFWAKHRQKIYAIVILVVGLLGGNMDRLGAILPEVYPEEVKERLNSLETYIEQHEQSHKELLEALKILSSNIEKINKGNNYENLSIRHISNCRSCF